MSLVGLRQQQATLQGARSKEQGGKRRQPRRGQERGISAPLAEAYQMLSAVYNWFTEGFDTRDLQEAKAMLAELDPAKIGRLSHSLAVCGGNCQSV